MSSFVLVLRTPVEEQLCFGSPGNHWIHWFLRCVAVQLPCVHPMLSFVSCPKEAPFSKSGFWLQKAVFWGSLLGAGPIRRDGLFVLKRKRKCVFCSREVPNIRPLRSMCFVHYMHFNVCDRPKKLLSQERLFGHAMKFLHDRKKNMICVKF